MPLGRGDAKEDFWRALLEAIERAEQGLQLSWDQRATIYTRFASLLPSFCERHDLGCPDGYRESLKRLVEGKRLEFFDRDGIKKIKTILKALLLASDQMQQAEADISGYYLWPTT